MCVRLSSPCGTSAVFGVKSGKVKGDNSQCKHENLHLHFSFQSVVAVALLMSEGRAGRAPARGLRKKTEEHMTMVASTPERVKSYFKDKHVSYAADSQ